MTTTKTIPDLLEAAHLEILDAIEQTTSCAIRDELNKACRAMDRAAVLAEEWEPHPEPADLWDELLDHCGKTTGWPTADGCEFENATIERPEPDYLSDWCRVTIGRVMWLFQIEADGDFDGERFVDKSRWTVDGRYVL